jgi:hypothetical protein
MQQFFLLFENEWEAKTQLRAKGLQVQRTMLDADANGNMVEVTKWTDADGVTTYEVGADRQGKFMMNVLCAALPEGLTALQPPENPKQRFAGY